MFEAKKAPPRGRPFAAWRIVVWLVMLLAAFGFVSSGAMAVALVQAISGAGSAPADARHALVIQLIWTGVTVAIAFPVMVIALATLRWREWARKALRVASLALIIVACWTAWTAWGAKGILEQQIAMGMQAGAPPEAIAKAMKDHSILLVAIVLKVVSVPVLAWLAWMLGSVRVRQQFAGPVL